MNSLYFMINLCLAIILFINGLLGRIQYGLRNSFFEYSRFQFGEAQSDNASGNFLQLVINPTIYLALICSVLQVLGYLGLIHSLWLLIPLFWGIRVLYIVLRNSFLYINKTFELSSCLISNLLGCLVYFGFISPLMSQNMSIMIPLDELRNALWYAIFAYCCATAWKIAKRSFSQDKMYPDEKKENIVLKRYDKFEKRYGSLIRNLTENLLHECSSDIQGSFICLVYAIMIYEDYNRPFFARIVENIVKRARPNKQMTLGIMQVCTKCSISDLQSVDIAIKQLYPPFVDSSVENPISIALYSYNQSSQYESEVSAIHTYLMELLSYDKLENDTPIDENSDDTAPCG